MNRCSRIAYRHEFREPPGGAVPSGMRAVSTACFSIGKRAEPAASRIAGGPAGRVGQNGSTELRTVLENVQILAVSSAGCQRQSPGRRRSDGSIEGRGHRHGGARRLRQPYSRWRFEIRLDEGTTPRHALTLAALFRASGKLRGRRGRIRASGNRAVLGSSHSTARPRSRCERLRRWGNCRLKPLKSLRALLGVSAIIRGAWPFRSGDAARKLIQNLQQKHELEMVSSERLMAGVGRPISYRAGAKPYQLHVQFAPEWMPNGKLGLRVKPQYRHSGTAREQPRKKYEAGLAGHVQFSGAGLRERSSRPKLGGTPVSRPFLEEHKHLVIFVSTQTIQQASPAAVARNTRQESGAVGAGAFLRSGLSHDLPGGRPGRAHRMVHAAAHGRGGGWPKDMSEHLLDESPRLLKEESSEQHLTMGPAARKIRFRANHAPAPAAGGADLVGRTDHAAHAAGKQCRAGICDAVRLDSRLGRPADRGSRGGPALSLHSALPRQALPPVRREFSGRARFTGAFVARRTSLPRRDGDCGRGMRAARRGRNAPDGDGRKLWERPGSKR